MRQSKQSDSPSGYCKDVYRKRVKPVIEHELAIRARERRRVLALVAKPMAELEEDSEFPGVLLVSDEELMARLRNHIERLERLIDLAFEAAAGGDARLARVILTEARWGEGYPA